MQNYKRTVPNILVTGTPGVGKSTLCTKLAESTGLNWVEISKVAEENNCLGEFDEVYQCPVLDEDKLLDGLEPIMRLGGNIVDYHGCDFFPERWFDVIYVLHTDNTTLYDRLTARGYSGKKLEDNIDCEIFQILAEEAKNSYPSKSIYELTNSTQEDLENNLQKMQEWIQEWMAQDEESQ